MKHYENRKAYSGGIQVQTQRIDYIDSLKGLAILCVVVGHIPEIYIRRGFTGPVMSKTLLDIMNIVYMFHMPLFMMISGFLYHRSYFDTSGYPDKKRIYRQIGNLVVVYALFNILCALFKILFGNSLNFMGLLMNIFLLWLRPYYNVYWYLYVLAFFYFLFSRKKLVSADKKVVFSILFIISLLASFTHIDWFKATNILYFALFFQIGMSISMNFQSRNTERRMILALLFGGGILMIIFWDHRPFEGFEEAVRIEEIPVVKLLVALAICLALWRLFEATEALHRCRMLTVLGRSSLEIYLLHEEFLSVFSIVFMKAGIRNIPFSICINVVLSIVLPIGFACILKHLKLYNLVFRPVTYLYDRVATIKTQA